MRFWGAKAGKKGGGETIPGGWGCLGALWVSGGGGGGGAR
eukprot:SAG22_NODE_20872_length_262_cov_0.625767_1_plen_39_part_10